MLVWLVRGMAYVSPVPIEAQEVMYSKFLAAALRPGVVPALYPDDPCRADLGRHCRANDG